MQQFLSIFDVFPMISPAASPSQAAYCALLGPKILKPAESGTDESSARNGGGENHFKVRGGGLAEGVLKEVQFQLFRIINGNM